MYGNPLQKQETEARLTRFQAAMKREDVQAAVITQNVDIYYLTGSMQAGYLIVPAAGEPKFYVRRSVGRARQESAVPVEPLGSFRAFGERLASDYPQLWGHALGSSPVKPVIGAEYDVLPVQQLQRLQGVLPPSDWKDISRAIREVRMIKSAYELERIREAARLIDEAFEDAIGRLKPGMTELELVAGVEYFIRLRGHLGIMRMRSYNQEVITGVVGAGEAAAAPTYFDGPGGGLGLSPASPQSASRRPIRRDEPVFIDIGCCIDGYVIDQTRTVVIGTLPEPLIRAYDVSEQILRGIEARLAPGAVCEQLYLDALKLADEAGLSRHFMGYSEDQVKFVGHGIGMEVDELPVLANGFRMMLQPGMVVAVEPKFTFPGLGIVGIENSYAITDSGYEKLTLSREGIIRI